MRKKKVLFSIYCLNNGGAERSLVNLLNEIDLNRYEVDLQLFTKEGLFLGQVPKGVNLLPEQKFLQHMYARNAKKTTGYYLDWLYKLAATGCARIVHRETPSRNAFRFLTFYDRRCKDLEQEYDAAVAFISGDVMFFVENHVKSKRKIVFVHNDYKTAKHPQKYEYPYFQKMDAIVTISDTCAQVFREEFPEFASKVLYLPNITSSAAIRARAEGSVPQELARKTLRIVSVGRLNEQKGFDMAVDAAGLLKQQGVDFAWYVLGSGALGESLEKQIREVGVEDRFFLLGSKENPYVYMKNADILAQTSRWEGKSVVLDEAKILGTPILTTDYPTARDQILDGEEGLIVGMSAREIAQGIEKMAQQPQLREQFRKFLLDHEYGNADEVQNYYQLFEQ